MMSLTRSRRMDRNRYKWQWNALITAALLLFAPTAFAAVCTIAAQGVNFGAYDPLSAQNLDGAGDLEVTCDVAAPYTISLSPGGGTFAARAMVAGVQRLFYNLYTEATRTTVWGDATASTATVSSTAMNETHTIYGLMPAGQNVSAGTYNDTIIVTLTF